MTRLRLASLLALVMAFSGAWATPVRVVESTRLVVSIAWVADADERAEVRKPVEAVRATRARVSVIGRPDEAAVRPVPLPYALYRRPPPASPRA